LKTTDVSIFKKYCTFDDKNFSFISGDYNFSARDDFSTCKIITLHNLAMYFLSLTFHYNNISRVVPKIYTLFEH
jgi:hypothetical protein